KKVHLWSCMAGWAAAGAALGALAGSSEKNDYLDPQDVALMTGVMFGACGAAVAAIQGMDDHYFIFGDSKRLAVAAARLRSRALFPTGLPAGFHSPAAPSPVETESDGTRALQPPLQRPKAARIHLMLGTAWTRTPANHHIVDAFKVSGFGGIEGGWFGPIEYPLDESRPFCRQAGVDFSLSPHFRLGLSLADFPVQKITGRDWERESANSGGYGFFIAYLPRPACPDLGARFEWSLGGGIGCHTLKVNGVLSSVFGIGVIEQPVFFQERKRCIGAHFRCGLDYYLSRNLSLQLQGEARIIPPLNLPLITYINPYNQEEKRLAPHSVNFSSLSLAAGLRFHF
ncbi:hypothetical protein GX408_14375, partial [bacterium]|nr:hypothetical protein [bacterium]